MSGCDKILLLSRLLLFPKLPIGCPLKLLSIPREEEPGPIDPNPVFLLSNCCPPILPKLEIPLELLPMGLMDTGGRALGTEPPITLPPIDPTERGAGAFPPPVLEVDVPFMERDAPPPAAIAEEVPFALDDSAILLLLSTDNFDPELSFAGGRLVARNASLRCSMSAACSAADSPFGIGAFEFCNKSDFADSVEFLPLFLSGSDVVLLSGVRAVKVV